MKYKFSQGAGHIIDIKYRSEAGILSSEFRKDRFQEAFIKANKKRFFRVWSPFLCLTLMVPDKGLSASCFANKQTGAASSFCGHVCLL